MLLAVRRKGGKAGAKIGKFSRSVFFFSPSKAEKC